MFLSYLISWLSVFLFDIIAVTVSITIRNVHWGSHQRISVTCFGVGAVVAGRVRQRMGPASVGGGTKFNMYGGFGGGRKFSGGFPQGPDELGTG